MASYSEEDAGILQIPAASPCRCDYQLRSCSSDCDSSRPQSPWLPRSQGHSDAAMSPFRLYESSAAAPRDRPNSLSGPLPARPTRGYYYNDHPSPLPSYFSGTTRASRQLVPSRSFAGRLPEARSYSRGSSFSRGEEACSTGDGEVGYVPHTSHLRSADETPRTRFSPSPTNWGMHSGQQNGRMRRNCMSGELGRSFEKAKVASRGYKSGEIVGLEIRTDGIFPIPESSRKLEDHARKDTREDGASFPRHRPSGSMLWEALNDADNESSPRRESSSSAMVPVPFKWEEASGCKPVSDSSTSRHLARISSTQIAKADSPSHSYCGGSEKTEDAAPASAKSAKSPSKAKAELDVGSSAVPFEWEVEPGKPKLREKLATSETAPALQLPPRLASAASMKRYSWSSSGPPTRARSTNYRSLSASLSGKHCHRSQPEEPPSPPTPRPPRGALSGALSQFGTPQYQSAEYFCEDSDRVRSPTSTLCGPGTPSSSSGSSDKSSTRKPSVSFSHSLTSTGTSAESFDHWSYGDHVSPRHPPRPHSFAESQSSNSRHDEGDQIDGAIVRLRRKLKLSSSKPPISPIRPPTVGFSSHGEEFFDCQEHISSPSPSRARIPKNRGVELPSDREEGVEPATRLPYKMPSPAHHDMEPKTESASSSPTRGGPEFTINCLALPRFLSRGDTATTPCQMWVENSGNARPTNCLEDGYRSPAYKATLELLSPSPNLMSKKSGVKLRSSSSRRHSNLVEVLCNSLKQSLQRCTKRSVAKTNSIVLYDDQFAKRHQSFMW